MRQRVGKRSQQPDPWLAVLITFFSMSVTGRYTKLNSSCSQRDSGRCLIETTLILLYTPYMFVMGWSSFISFMPVALSLLVEKNMLMSILSSVASSIPHIPHTDRALISWSSKKSCLGAQSRCWSWIKCFSRSRRKKKRKRGKRDSASLALSWASSFPFKKPTACLFFGFSGSLWSGCTWSFSE